MARIRLMTDSACDLPDDLAHSLDIGIVPLTIRFGDEEFTDRTELTPDQFWAKCKASATLPETAAPSPGTFQEAYEATKAAGYDGALVLTLSSLVSATHQAASLAAQAVAGSFDVRVIDTRNVSMGQGLLVVELAERAAAGATLDELERVAESLIDRAGVCGTLDTLEHLIKGGRVGGAKALLGQVLSVKPLIELRAGIVEEAGRQRTRAKALAAVAAAGARVAPLSRLALIQGACTPADIATLTALVAQIEVDHPLVVANIGPVVGTHAGPGVIGLAWISR